MVKSTQQLIAARISSVQQILDTYSNSLAADMESSGGSSSAAAGAGTGKMKKVIRRRRVVRRRR
jgi:hypothetical protein